MASDVKFGYKVLMSTIDRSLSPGKRYRVHFMPSIGGSVMEATGTFLLSPGRSSDHALIFNWGKGDYLIPARDVLHVWEIIEADGQIFDSIPRPIPNMKKVWPDEPASPLRPADPPLTAWTCQIPDIPDPELQILHVVAAAMSAEALNDAERGRIARWIHEKWGAR